VEVQEIMNLPKELSLRSISIGVSRSAKIRIVRVQQMTIHVIQSNKETAKERMRISSMSSAVFGASKLYSLGVVK
jgi:hypothetical protein